MHADANANANANANTDAGCSTIALRERSSELKIKNFYHVNSAKQLGSNKMPSREIMVFFVLHKLILQKLMCSYPVELDI